MNDQRKPCPYCGEQIPSAATKCGHCDGAVASQAADATPAAEVAAAAPAAPPSAAAPSGKKETTLGGTLGLLAFLAIVACVVAQWFPKTAAAIFGFFALGAWASQTKKSAKIGTALAAAVGVIVILAVGGGEKGNKQASAVKPKGGAVTAGVSVPRSTPSQAAPPPPAVAATPPAAPPLPETPAAAPPPSDEKPTIESACGAMGMKSYAKGALTCVLETEAYGDLSDAGITAHTELGDLVGAFDDFPGLKSIAVVEYAVIEGEDIRGNARTTRTKIAEVMVTRRTAAKINWSEIRWRNIPKVIDRAWGRSGVPYLVE